MPRPGWRTSTHSGSDGNCVEAGGSPDGVLVRDTQDREGPVLEMTPAAWREFCRSLKTA